MKETTLVILHDHPRVLLGRKKRGFGEGKWNGFGGKVEADESIAEAAKREMKEESGLDVKRIEKTGVLQFAYPDDEDGVQFDNECHIFRATDWEGEHTESKEMMPKWFHVDEIPFDEMWPDDRHWMPHLLAGQEFSGVITFDEDGRMLSCEITKT